MLYVKPVNHPVGHVRASSRLPSQHWKSTFYIPMYRRVFEPVGIILQPSTSNTVDINLPLYRHNLFKCANGLKFTPADLCTPWGKWTLRARLGNLICQRGGRLTLDFQ